MNTDFVAQSFDDTIALQKIREYCDHRLQEQTDDDMYDLAVDEVCSEILQISNGGES